MTRSKLNSTFHKLALHTSTLTCVVLLWPSFAAARHVRVAQIPNGSVKSCANCHLNPSGGGPRNGFGSEIEANFLSVPGSAGVVQWGPQLAALNSDGDAKSNGLELQDPNGTWALGSASPGSAILVTNPGEFDQPPAVPALGGIAALCLAAGLAATGARNLRKRTAHHAR
jgi:hypothetical protein